MWKLWKTMLIFEKLIKNNVNKKVEKVKNNKQLKIKNVNKKNTHIFLTHFSQQPVDIQSIASVRRKISKKSNNNFSKQ